MDGEYRKKLIQFYMVITVFITLGVLLILIAFDFIWSLWSLSLTAGEKIGCATLGIVFVVTAIGALYNFLKELFAAKR
jgi:hypothetical protein